MFTSISLKLFLEQLHKTFYIVIIIVPQFTTIERVYKTYSELIKKLLVVQIVILVDFVILNWLQEAFGNWLNKLLVDYSNLLQI